jgi:cyclopropane-fatty-acyl-phospholipid synthase
MSAVAIALTAFEGAPLPDPIRRAAVRFLVDGARRDLSRSPGDEAFAAEMAEGPIALATDAANEQHYELPTVFFEHILGPRMKYSSCLYPTSRESLAEAERLALAETCVHADLADGQTILELGCGWGSLSLWMAETLPNSRILSVSNSAPQRQFIEARARERGLTNLEVVTADMNDFQTIRGFDRVVSVEMFEHMTNWRKLLGRVLGWLNPGGRLFLHVFSHRSASYRFDANDPADWIAQHFFTGGIMPSHQLIRQFDLFEVEEDWRWSGSHYERTANDWLANYDRNAEVIWPVLREVYGDQARLWHRRWRLFFLATAGLFGHAGGFHWGVSHYRLKRADLKVF